MSNLKCPRCGNDKKFYQEVNIMAKLRVDNKGNDLKRVYDIKKDLIDNYFGIIYCCECDTEVENNI